MSRCARRESRISCPSVAFSITRTPAALPTVDLLITRATLGPIATIQPVSEILLYPDNIALRIHTRFRLRALQIPTGVIGAPTRRRFVASRESDCPRLAGPANERPPLPSDLLLHLRGIATRRGCTALSDIADTPASKPRPLRRRHNCPEVRVATRPGNFALTPRGNRTIHCEQGNSSGRTSRTCSSPQRRLSW